LYPFLRPYTKISSRCIKELHVRAGGVDQVVEHLPSKGEALHSNPSTILHPPPQKRIKCERKNSKVSNNDNKEYL
jgi:hypothetical protein